MPENQGKIKLFETDFEHLKFAGSNGIGGLI